MENEKGISVYIVEDYLLTRVTYKQSTLVLSSNLYSIIPLCALHHAVWYSFSRCLCFAKTGNVINIAIINKKILQVVKYFMFLL